MLYKVVVISQDKRSNFTIKIALATASNNKSTNPSKNNLKQDEKTEFGMINSILKHCDDQIFNLNNYLQFFKEVLTILIHSIHRQRLHIFTINFFP
jgi:hypothetical protein